MRMNIRGADLIRHRVLNWIYRESGHPDALIAAWERLLSFDDFDLERVPVPRETCRWGHPFTAENTRMQGKVRICRACHSERAYRSYQKLKQKERTNGHRTDIGIDLSG